MSVSRLFGNTQIVPNGALALFVFFGKFFDFPLIRYALIMQHKILYFNGIPHLFFEHWLIFKYERFNCEKPCKTCSKKFQNRSKICWVVQTPFAASS